MRRVALALVMTSLWLAVSSGQQQVRGQVVNRDGAPQQCQVDFYQDSRHIYGVNTDYKGYFLLTNPRYDIYRVEVTLGNRREVFKEVKIDQYGLHPPTLVVPW
jgi:hypothetical protein